MTKILKKWRIRTIAFAPKPKHIPDDENDDTLGSMLVMTKGEIDEELLLKSIKEETDLLDNEEEEFDVDESKELFKSGFTEKDNSFVYGTGIELEKSFQFTPVVQKGLKLYAGLKDNECKLQAIELDKKHFTSQGARDWLKLNIHSLKKGETFGDMELNEILKGLDKKFDEKLTPITKQMEGLELRLTKAEQPKDPPKEVPKPDEGKMELEKSFKEQTETTNKSLTEIKELLKGYDDRLKNLEEQPFGSGQVPHAGFTGVLNKGGQVEVEGGYVMKKGADGEVRFQKKNNSPQEIVLKISPEQLQNLGRGSV